MGFTEVLTLIFITLKLTHYIDWSWWLVLSPTIIAFCLFFTIAFFSVFLNSGSVYRRKKK